MSEHEPQSAVSPVEFFAGHPAGQVVAQAVTDLVTTLGPHTIRIGRSQVAFRRRRGFAYLWRPGQYVRSDAPAVLSLALPRRDEDPRWKEVAHPATGIWMHHLELASPAEVDDEVRGWLVAAYEAAA